MEQVKTQNVIFEDQQKPKQGNQLWQVKPLPNEYKKVGFGCGFIFNHNKFQSDDRHIRWTTYKINIGVSVDCKD